MAISAVSHRGSVGERSRPVDAMGVGTLSGFWGETAAGTGRSASATAAGCGAGK
jgi:hypothetical protein